MRSSTATRWRTDRNWRSKLHACGKLSIEPKPIAPPWWDQKKIASTCIKYTSITQFQSCEIFAFFIYRISNFSKFQFFFFKFLFFPYFWISSKFHHRHFGCSKKKMTGFGLGKSSLQDIQHSEQCLLVFPPSVAYFDDRYFKSLKKRPILVRVLQSVHKYDTAFNVTKSCKRFVYKFGEFAVST